MKKKYVKTHLLNIVKIILIIFILIMYYLFYNIKVPSYIKRPRNELYKLYTCVDHGLEGNLQQSFSNYAIIDLESIEPNYHEQIFWFIIYLENMKFSKKSWQTQSMPDIMNTITNGMMLYFKPHIINVPNKLNSYEKILFSADRMDYWSNLFVNFYLKNHNFKKIPIRDIDDDELVTTYEWYTQLIKQDFTIKKITNYLDKNNLPEIEKNATYGSNYDALYLYTYYKNIDEEKSLAWLQIAAENGSDLGQRLFLSYLKNTNKVYSYTNTNYNWLGNETYKNFPKERASFWEKVINNQETDNNEPEINCIYENFIFIPNYF